MLKYAVTFVEGEGFGCATVLANSTEEAANQFSSEHPEANILEVDLDVYASAIRAYRWSN